MAQSLKFDTSEVEAYADLLVDSAGVAPKEARKVVAKGALNVKTDARRRRSGSKHFPRLPTAITYDSHETPGGGWAEVGPDHAKPQGELGHIPEYGALKTAPEPYMRPAAEREMPRFEKAMEALAVKGLDR
jgi:hypothetical protein